MRKSTKLSADDIKVPVKEVKKEAPKKKEEPKKAPVKDDKAKKAPVKDEKKKAKK